MPRPMVLQAIYLSRLTSYKLLAAEKPAQKKPLMLNQRLFYCGAFLQFNAQLGHCLQQRINQQQNESAVEHDLANFVGRRVTMFEVLHEGFIAH